MKRYIAFLIVFLFFQGLTFAQGINLDSLYQVWEDESKHDTIRLDAFNDYIYYGFQYSNPDSASKLADEGYAFAKKGGYKEYMSLAFKTKGISSSMMGDDRKAIEYFEECVAIEQTMNDPVALAMSLNNLGIMHKKLGDYIRAIEHYDKSLKLLEMAKDSAGMAKTIGNLGNLYYSMGDMEAAERYYRRGLEIREAINDREGLGAAMFHIAMIYDYKEQPDSTILAYRKCIEISRETNRISAVGMSYGGIGAAFHDKNQLDSAIYYFKMARELYSQIGDNSSLAYALKNMGLVYEDLGDFNKAFALQTEAYELAQKLENQELISATSENLYQLYRQKGDFRNALLKYEEHIAIRDTLQSESNQRALIHQEYEYEYEKQATKDSIQAAEAAKVKDAELVAEQAENDRRKQQSYFLYAGLGIALLFVGFIYNRFKLTQKQKGIIEEQKHIVEEKNQEIVDSITYAKRIQTAILPPPKIVKEYLEDSFILYLPKDIVAGDFYWMEPTDEGVLIAAADCTGHGVPGAMVSVICNNGLNRSVREFGLRTPGEILDKTREIVLQEFEKSEEDVKDGMDIALCKLQGNKLEYAGAHNPLWIIRNGAIEIEEIKATKQPIGKFENPEKYTTHNVELIEGDTVYFFSDGFADQFGGEKGKKLKAANFKKILLGMQDMSMFDQMNQLQTAFDDWKGSFEQLDDVCVIGVRV